MASPEHRALKLALCGGLAGIVAKTTVAPLERVRILAQTGEAHGFGSTVRQVAGQEGLRGFWRGNAVNCLRVFPNKAVLFCTNDSIKQGLLAVQGGEQLSAGWLFAAGSLSGLTATGATYPLDVIRTRLTGRLGVRDGPMALLRAVLAEDGWRGLYRGITPTLLGALPYEGIKFGSYDMMKRWLAAEQQRGGAVSGSGYQDMHIGWKLACSAAAGTIAGIVLFPNDTVRRLLQVQGSRGVGVQYKGMLDCYRSIWRQQGPMRFYRGLGPYLLRIVPNSVVQFQSYETLKQMAGLSTVH